MHINRSRAYAASAYSATARKKELADDPVSLHSRQTEDSVDISAEAAQKLLEQRAEKAFTGAPATFEEMEEGLGKKQQEIADIMNEAREVSGYDGPVTQTAQLTAYRVGPYAVYCQESGQWQWHNEDGTPRSDRPSAEEHDEQSRISEEKIRKHMAYLRDNDIFGKFEALSRDASLLKFAKNDSDFREDYMSDPVEAVRKNAEKLLDSYQKYHYTEMEDGVLGRFYHS